MTDMIRRRRGVLALALGCFTFSAPAHGVDTRAIVPEVLSRDEEVALAESAAPAHLRAKAAVYVLEQHRGKGLSRALLDAVFAHPELQGLRRFMLATRDAHGLYAKYGFGPLQNHGRIMMRGNGHTDVANGHTGT